jgi:sulfide dehydrogenase cytochrome subunit
MRLRPKFLLLCTVAALAAAAAHQPPPARAQTADARLLALSCAGCHGPDGQSPGTIPSLRGKNEATISDALRGFRADQRPSTVMGRVAKGYSDQEIDAVAREIAARWK